MKCFRDGCGNKAVTSDFRPAYKDEDGDWDCFGKVMTCDECVGLDHENWHTEKTEPDNDPEPEYAVED